MTTITIANDITLTASVETINEYRNIVNRRAELNRWMQSALEERDWEDYEDYHWEAVELEERMLRLGA